ncbi:MAG: surface lipoprotein assembly modifier [Hyphomicrobiales bacterium]
MTETKLGWSKVGRLWAAPIVLFMFFGNVVVAEGRVAASNAQIWQSALSQLKQNNLINALPHLEQLVTRDPSNIEYRYELALTLLKLGQYGRAKHHLDLLSATKLSPGARSAVENLRSQISERNKISGYFSFEIVPESNVAKQTENGIIDIGGIPFQLNAIGEPGVSVKIDAGVQYTEKVNKNITLKIGLDLSARLNEEEKYRDISLVGRTGLAFSSTPKSSFEAGLLLGKRWLADEKYSNTSGAYFGYHRKTGQKGQVSMNLQLAHTTHVTNSPDNNIATVQLSYTHGVSVNSQVTFGVFHQITNSSDVATAGKNTGAKISGLYAFPKGIVAGLSLSYAVDQREGYNPVFFTQARKDNSTKLDVTLHHRDFRIGGYAPQLIMGVERNKSNNVLADYTNKYMSIGFTRKF